jgi:hypothetical protein
VKELFCKNGKSGVIPHHEGAVLDRHQGVAHLRQAAHQVRITCDAGVKQV